MRAMKQHTETIIKSYSIVADGYVINLSFTTYSSNPAVVVIVIVCCLNFILKLALEMKITLHLSCTFYVENDRHYCKSPIDILVLSFSKMFSSNDIAIKM